jgi:hypothetical protein
MDVVCSSQSTTEMDRRHLKHYTDAEIRQLYYCKSYLKVKIISDLCTADGLFVLPLIMKGELSIRQCVSKLEDIRQERPDESKWSIWRKFLKTICKDNDNNRNETTTRTADNKETHTIGTTITKYWNGIPYIEKVINKTDKYYKIKYYNDNDEEELNHGEVQKYMDKNRGNGRSKKEIGTRMRLRQSLGDWNHLAND